MTDIFSFLQRTTSNYLLGNRQMSLLPVMISATVTYVSTQTLIGMPSEIYAFGAQFWVAIIGSGTASALACVVFVPVFYPLKLTSVNEVSFSGIVKIRVP